MPTISAMVDGEATPEQMLELRPHLRNCPGCRATLKALQDSSEPLAVVLPVPLAAVVTGAGEQLTNVFMRAYEAIAGGFHERAVHSVTKAQAAIEAAAGGKVAAVAASAAAAAGGGYATVERTVTPGHVERAGKFAKHQSARSTPKVPVRQSPVARPAPVAGPLVERPLTTPAEKPTKSATTPSPHAAPEFEAGSSSQQQVRAASTTATPAPTPRASSTSAPVEYATSTGAVEFGP